MRVTEKECDTKNRLFLIDSYCGQAAVSIYVNQIKIISRIPSEVFSVCLHSRTSTEFTGRVIQRFKFVLDDKKKRHVAPISEYFFNRICYKQTLKEYFENYTNTSRLKNTIVHYADITPPPSIQSDISTVTVHDLSSLSTRCKPQNFEEWRFSRNFSRYINQYKKFHKILADSRATQRDMQNEGFEGEIRVIYPPVWPDFRQLQSKKNVLRKELGLPQDKSLILSVSSADRRKNLLATSETVSILGENFKLIRVGPAIGNSIAFQHIDLNKLNKIYNACDVLLLPSLAEGFGYPLAEAMTAGLPIVASNIEVIEEVVGDAGILVSPEPQILAQGIKDALNDSEALVNRGLEMSKKYTMYEFSNQMNNFYDSLLRDNSV